MTILLIISFFVFDREEMLWTYLVWGGMVTVIVVDYRLWRKKRDKVKQNKP